MAASFGWWGPVLSLWPQNGCPNFGIKLLTRSAPREAWSAIFYALPTGDQRLIENKGIKSKTHRCRLITMNDTLMAWLEAFPPPEGRLVPLGHIDTFGTELRRLAKLAGIDAWPHNALRHTFGSNFLATTQNENRCAVEMGNTPDVVVRHYRARVKPLDAARFWAIRPPTQKAQAAP
jgi:hypothetical protein